jgi:hypothetical protein
MIGIHDSPGGYSDRWLETCRQQGIPFKRVDCLASDIIQQCAGLNAVLWHWTLVNLREPLVARQVLTALQLRGLQVFPSPATCWHYDDKVGQKFLLESIDAPLIPTWVFTDPAQAERWIASTSWPKVFKLRCGAGSDNVRLVRSAGEARALCRRAFGSGFPATPGYLFDASNRLRHTTDWRDFAGKLRRVPQSIANTLRFRRFAPRQHGYLLFQEFLPGNDFDTRVTIIGRRAFGARRYNRPNDFRASGSGQASFDPDKVDRRCVQIAFDVAQRLNSQSLAIDFLMDTNREPRICEISYCSVSSPVYDCTGYWDRDLNWFPGHFWPQDCILADVLAAVAGETTDH